MKIHVTNLYGQSPLSVALMSQNMVADIAKSMGSNFREIGVYAYNANDEPQEQLMSRIDGMNAAVSNGDIVIFQSPTWNGTRFDEAYIRRLKIYHGLKIVIFIHDVHPLMFQSNFYLMDKTIDIYNLADLIIVPSEKMLLKLRDLGLTVEKTLIQHVWDYTTKVDFIKPSFAKSISFAGNPSRFPFMTEWTLDYPLHVFSSEILEQRENVISEGWKFSVDLLASLSKLGGFGLVWQQGDTEEYYELNISYKLSTYLASGLPVIVPKSLSNAWMVEKYGLGYVIETLDEIDNLMSNITEDVYQKLVENVYSFRELISDGYFIKKLLIDTVHELKK